MKSWKTTLAGIMTFVTLAWNQIQYAIDSDPLTNPEWSLVITGLIAMIGFFKARDNDVSSEDEGVK